MVGTSLGIGAAVVELTGMAVGDFMRLAGVPPGFVDIPPRPLRQVLLTIRSSIQARIPEILGDDEEERIEILVALLDGTSEEDLNTLVKTASEALSRLEAEKRHKASRRRRPDRHRRQRGRSVAWTGHRTA